MTKSAKWQSFTLQRILQANIREKFKVDKFKQSTVKLKERAHHFVVDIEGETLVEFVRTDPGNGNAHNFNPVVHAFD